MSEATPLAPSGLFSVLGDKGDSSLKDWLALLKPRVISLVVFTGAAGMAVAPQWPSIPIGLITILCICIGAGAAGAIICGMIAISTQSCAEPMYARSLMVECQRIVR